LNVLGYSPEIHLEYASELQMADEFLPIDSVHSQYDSAPEHDEILLVL